ncbi:excisionase family DNA-binding protein [Rhizobium gallicum]|uniref:excisionase family DNA-binding protein n=1 Tax=Rhizobium gallicum TaxID=56730 RepID=UPI001CC230D2|nr:excisionase family DNA-binding protein [Rhizobium gallicum]
MLSTQAAADILNGSRQYLVRSVDAGELPAEKVGSHRRLRVAEIAAFKAPRGAKWRSGQHWIGWHRSARIQVAMSSGPSVLPPGT